MKEKLLTLREASHILKLSEKDVIELAHDGQIPHFKIGTEFLRFKKDDILKVKGHIHKRFGIQREHHHWKEQVKEFVYFNDFYIISGIVIVTLLWIIFKG